MVKKSLLAAGLVVVLAGTGAWAQSRPDVAAGRALARESCSECHAIGGGGKSSRKEAPPFRTLWKRYNIDSLQEAFAEGISVGHKGRDMPEFEFSPEETDALIAYIKSLKK